MKLKNNILNFLIYAYVILLPLIPSKFKYKEIPFNGDIILLIIFFVYFIKLVFSKNTRERFILGIKDFFNDYLSLFIGVSVLIMFVSITYSLNKKVATKEGLRFFSYVILYFIIKYEIHNKNVIHRILKCYIFVCTLISSIGIYQYIEGMGVLQKSEFGLRKRIESSLENSNNLGMFLIFCIFPLIMLIIYEKNKIKKIFYSIVFVLSFTNIILCFSRNAWIGLVIGFIVLAIIYSPKFLGVFIGIGGISLFIPQVTNRIREFGDISQNVSRLKLWKTALLMIKDHPILGIGNGNFSVLYNEYITKYPELRYCSYKVYHPHNIFLKAQCELGIIGLIALLGMLICIFLKLKKLINNKEETIFYKVFYLGFIASMGAFLFMNSIDNFFSAPKVIAYFWILLAIAQWLLYNHDEGCFSNIN